MPEKNSLAENITKIVIPEGSSPENMEHFLTKKGYPLTVHHHKMDNLFDITPQQENKYISLVNPGTDFSKAIAFGNDANDHAVLHHAAISVFIGSMND